MSSSIEDDFDDANAEEMSENEWANALERAEKAMNSLASQLQSPLMPKRHKSKQDYVTPREFIDAVIARFGPLSWDLAATADNKQAPRYFSYLQNSLDQDWNNLVDGNAWLNPPFEDVEPWAEKCAAYTGTGRIFLLTPASTGANWFASYIFQQAQVILIKPRITFEGCEDPYPKDCILSIFGPGVTPGINEIWTWRAPRKTRVRKAKKED
jgi:phage N-6-adenine-methyltransferase